MNYDKDANCFFCSALQEEDGPQNLVVARCREAFIILNRYPYTSGHLMIVPYVHSPSLEGLPPESRGEMIELASQAMQVLRNIYRPDGFNLGMNIGDAAGAAVAGHVHMHVVPRWVGDTNFMSSLAQTRVLPESLEDSYQRIRQGWETLYRG